MPLTRGRLQAAGVAVVSVVLAVAAALLAGGDDQPTTARDPGSTSSPAPSSTGASSSAPGSSATGSSASTDPESGLPLVRERDLPSLERQTLALIDDGGPFPDAPKDGSTFGNYEGLLPEEGRGYYQEYTVLHPGSSSRGARRIITGDGGEFYWTADHYESFSRIVRS